MNKSNGKLFGHDNDRQSNFLEFFAKSRNKDVHVFKANSYAKENQWPESYTFLFNLESYCFGAPILI